MAALQSQRLFSPSLRTDDQRQASLDYDEPCNETVRTARTGNRDFTVRFSNDHHLIRVFGHLCLCSVYFLFRLRPRSKMSLVYKSQYVLYSVSSFIFTCIVLYYILTGRGSRLDVAWVIEGTSHLILLFHLLLAAYPIREIINH